MEAATTASPGALDYLQKGQRLIQVLWYDDKGCLHAEDAVSDERVVISPGEIAAWNIVKRAKQDG